MYMYVHVFLFLCISCICILTEHSFIFNSFLGIRILSGEGLTDAKQAKGISFRQDYVDIYSCSWGPTDYGYEVEEAGVMTEAALRQGAFEV